MPNEVLEIIRLYDISEPPLVCNQRMNLGFGNILGPQISDEMIHGRIIPLGMKNRDQFLGIKSKSSATKLEGLPVSMTCDPHTGAHMIAAGSMYIHDAIVHSLKPLHLHMDHRTLLIPLDDDFKKSQTDEWWNVEQFAGGFGGWMYANRFLHRHTVTKRRTVAIEKELPFATQYALTHGSTLVGDLTDISSDFLRTHPNDVIFTCDIKDVAWQKQCENLFVEIWTISAPCKSWSFASKYEGLNRPDGQAMVHAIAQARIFKPKLIGFEQVQAFAQHPHFPIIERLLSWAGFTPLFQEVLDMEDLTPVRRSRWLGLYAQTKDYSPETHEHVLESIPRIPTTVCAFDASLELSTEERRYFQPQPTEAAMYFEPNLMPGKLRKWLKQEIIQYRLPEEILPTFMAAYGQQHKIRPDLLGTHGLFGFFRRDGCSFRFWSPSEISLLHGLFHGVILLKPATIAWQTLGNSITPIHAMFVLYHAFKWLGDFHEPITLPEVVREFLDGRLRASDIHKCQDACAWYVGTLIETGVLQSRLQYFMAQMSWSTDESNYWPKGYYFSPQEGLTPFREPSTDVAETIEDTIISPTEAFALQFEIMPYLIPGEYGILKVDGNTKWRTLLNLWDFKLQPTAFAFDWSQVDQTIQDTMPVMSTFLSPVDDFQKVMQQLAQVNAAIPAIPVLVRDSTDLTLYEVERSSTWKQLRNDKNIPQKSWYHAFGPITDTQWFSHPVEITESPTNTTAIDSFHALLPFLMQMSLEVITPVNTDILCLHCQGPPQAYDAFSAVWHSSDIHQWLATKGRQANLQRTSETTWRYILRPLLPQTSIPTTMIREEMFVRILIKMLQSMQTPDGVECIFKYQSNALFRGRFPSQMSLAPFWAIVKHGFAIMEPNRQPSLVSAGKICADACIFQDLLDRKLRPGTVIIAICQPILGGGPTAKQEFAKMIEADTASMFLEYGVHLTQVPNMTAKLLQEVGQQRLHHILHGEGGDRKFQSFEAICQACHIDLPKYPKLSSTKAKHQRTKDRKSNKTTMMIDPEQFHLQEGFFLNSDDTAANVLTQFSPNASGIMLMTASKAKDWLLATSDLATDELAIYVVGPIEVPSKFESLTIHAPAFNSNRQPVLLNGVLIQLGSKKIKTAVDSPDKVSLRDVQVCSITVWKEDWDTQMWNAILTAPVKTLKHLLTLDGHQGLFGKPWARTFQHQGQHAEPAQATSFQVHGEFENNGRFPGLLQKSGFNKMYITPKDESGKPHPSWKVIWLDQTAVQIEAKTSTLTGTAGLVKGRKSLGIRIESGSFQLAWSKLKPGEPLPDMRQTALVFKIQPLPQGTTAENLTEWGKLSNWNIKPIKALGAKQWIVGSDTPPPAILLFNGHPILAQQLYQKGLRDQSAIAAGPRRLQPSPKVESADKPNIFKMGDPFSDPWTPAVRMPAGTAEVPKTEPRSTTGPVAENFQQHDKRITAVEEAIQRLQDTQTASTAQLDNRFQCLDQKLQQHAATTQTRFENMHQETVGMHQALQQALSQQDNRIAASFDEIKQLFLTAKGTKRAPDSEERMRE